MKSYRRRLRLVYMACPALIRSSETFNVFFLKCGMRRRQVVRLPSPPRSVLYYMVDEDRQVILNEAFWQAGGATGVCLGQRLP